MSGTLARRDGLAGRVDGASYSVPEGLPFEAWVADGHLLGRIHRASAFWIGDWINEGERAFGEKYAQALDVLGLDYGTLRNYASLAARFAVSRRRDTLTPSHHAEVLALPTAEQDALLERALAGGWTRSRLRDEVRRLARVRRERELAERRALAAEAAPGERWRVTVADIADWHPDETVDAIITDPPYISDDAIELLGELARFALRCLRPGGALVVMTWTPLIAAAIAALTLGELRYSWTISWSYATSANTPLHAHRVFDCWKPVLVFHHGEPDPERPWFRDEIRSPGAEKRHHPWGQNVEGFLRLVRGFAHSGELVCDPFLGGGTTGVAALQERRRFVGADIDGAAVATAAARLADVESEDQENAA